MSYNLYWGDSHTNIHSRHIDELDQTLNHAQKVLDFFPIAYYPFYYYKENGLRVESCGHKEKFDSDWDLVSKMIHDKNDPENFVTFLGYEWHGDRRRYGDHNVFYLNDFKPLQDCNTIQELYQFLQEKEGIALPHHTGYKVKDRGKNWDYFDPEISPLAEIFSAHGSSEGCNTPYTLENNKSMGPRVYSGSIQAGLARGHKFGFIASGDSHYGVPGVWGNGLMGVYAEKLTRKDLWQAFKARRTYAVTGDRIELKFETSKAFMGEVISGNLSPEFKVEALGSGAIDRIDLIKNNKLYDSFINTSSSKSDKNQNNKYKLRLSFGWGPENYFNKLWNNWQGKIEIEEGEIIEVEPAYTYWNQQFQRENSKEVSWDLTTKARTYKQQLIFTVKGKPESRIKVKCNGKKISSTLKKLLTTSLVLPYKKQCREQIQKQFGLAADNIENPDVFYHNSFKMKLHQVVPYDQYKVDHIFKDNNVTGSETFYYCRVHQKDGQMAWSSPIWVQN